MLSPMYIHVALYYTYLSESMQYVEPYVHTCSTLLYVYLSESKCNYAVCNMYTALYPISDSTCSSSSLGSRPSPYVRVLIARGWANRSSGKAWDDSSREA